MSYRPVFLELESRDLLSVITVGPGEQYPTPDKVPWSSLQPQTQVDIYWQADAYHSKIDINQSGITVNGILGPQNQLPVLDGASAVENVDAAYFSDGISNAGVIIVAPSTGDYQVTNVVVSNLEVMGGYGPGAGFTDRYGEQAPWNNSSAGIALYSDNGVTISHCSIHGNGNGIFGKSDANYGTAGNEDLYNVHLIGNHVYANGIIGSDRQHDTYLEGFYTTYEFNTYGPLIDGAIGGALKDRSDQPTVAYNYITGGNYQLEMIEADDGSPDLTADPNYGRAWVYGNVIYDNNDSPNIVLAGSDGSGPTAQPGPLYFYNNTVVDQNDGIYGNAHTHWFKSNGDTIYAFDNIFWAYPPVGGSGWYGYIYLSASEFGGATVYTGANVVNFDLTANDDGSTTTYGWSNTLLVGNPGFVNLSTGDYRLCAGSPAVNAAQGYWDLTGFHSLASENLPVPVYEYSPPSGCWVARSAVTSIGEWEYSSGPGTVAGGWDHHRPVDLAYWSWLLSRNEATTGSANSDVPPSPVAVATMESPLDVVFTDTLNAL